MNAPLEGIVVADFSRVLAGPLATATLADLGATVIKVERPGVGDDTRHWGPPWSPTTSAYFESANRSKQSVELDLADPEDRQVALSLASSADVLVENFRPGSLTAMGLGYDDLAARNPGLVYCSISGFGSGRGADLPGYDFLVQAVGGLMSITGSPDQEPTKVGVALVDVLTSKDAVSGILAALLERQTSGAGQLVQVNLLSSLLGSLANQATSYLATGTSPRRMGNQHPSIAPYETLQCADGALAVCCGNDGQFAKLVVALGSPKLATDVRFRTNADRVEHQQHDQLVARPGPAHGSDRTVCRWRPRDGSRRGADVVTGPTTTRVHVVTGGASGIGRAVVHQLAADGNHVVLADIDAAASTRVATEVSAATGGPVTGTALDVSSREDWHRVMLEVDDEHGRLDGLVNNAGITRDAAMRRMDDDAWRSAIDVHLRGSWLGCQAAASLLGRSDNAAIVNISSSGRHGVYGQTNYSSAKAGIIGLTKAVASELARQGTRCNTVAPGAVNTPMTAMVAEDIRRGWEAQLLLRRLAEPEEIASAVCFLLSPAASYITTQVLDVNGGEPHL